MENVTQLLVAMQALSADVRTGQAQMSADVHTCQAQMSKEMQARAPSAW